MFNGLTIRQFKGRFPTNEACMQYLVDLKWGQGYKCKKCSYSQYGKGRQWFYRRCKSCAYDESATANTISHGVKLELLRVFELAYRIVVRKKGMSTLVNWLKSWDVNKKQPGNGKPNFNLR